MNMNLRQIEEALMGVCGTLGVACSLISAEANAIQDGDESGITLITAEDLYYAITAAKSQVERVISDLPAEAS